MKTCGFRLCFPGQVKNTGLRPARVQRNNKANGMYVRRWFYHACSHAASQVVRVRAASPARVMPRKGASASGKPVMSNRRETFFF